jgi:hypothetical protein
MLFCFTLGWRNLIRGRPLGGNRYPVPEPGILQVESLLHDRTAKIGRSNERCFRCYKTSFVDKDPEFDTNLIEPVDPDPGDL